MATTNRSTIVSAFADDAQAQQAMNDLQQAGFRPDQIRYSVHKGGAGIIDSLADLGLPEQESTFYNREFEAGRTVVLVNAADRRADAYDILRRNRGYDFESQARQRDGYASTVGTDNNYANTADTEGEQRLRLHEEQLRAQKQTVETGEARLQKDVVSEQKNIEVPVTHEEVYIERRPGSGQPADQPIGEQGETYRVPVREEQVTVEKQPFVREEIALGKRPVQENKQFSDTVRREEAHVEQSGDINVRDNNAE